MNGQRKLIAILAIIGIGGVAQAQTPTAVAICNPCSGVNGLNAAVTKWAQAHNIEPTTIVLMTSSNAPFSGFFQVRHDRVLGLIGYPLTTTDTAAVALDNQVFARALKHPPIYLPSVPYTASDATIIGDINSYMLYYADNGMTLRLQDLNTLPFWQSWQYLDLSSGKTLPIWLGDVVNVAYANGYAENWQCIGTSTTGGQYHFLWQRVAGSLTHNGQKVNPPSTKPAKPVPPTSVNGPNIWNDAQSSIFSGANSSFCYGSSAVTMTLGGDTVTGYGVFVYPC
jgi:hypothetical protein